MRLWDTDYHSFIAYACSRIFRDFTPNERQQFLIPDDSPTCPEFGEQLALGTRTPLPLPTPNLNPISSLPTWTLLPLFPKPTPSPAPTLLPSAIPSPVPTPLPKLAEFSDYGAPVGSLAFSPDGQMLLVGSSLSVDATGGQNYAIQWDINTEHVLQRLEGHKDYVISLAYSPDRRYAATGSRDKTARIWDLKTGQTLYTLEGNTNWVSSVAFSPDGQYVVTAGKDGSVRLWTNGREIRQFIGHTQWVNNAVFSSDGRYLVTGSDDHTVRLWNVKTAKEIKSFASEAGINFAAISPDGHYVVGGDSEGRIKVWDIDSKEQVTEIAMVDAISNIVFSSDSRYLLASTFADRVGLWDATGHIFSLIWSQSGNGSYAVAAISPNNRIIAVGNSNGVELYDTQPLGITDDANELTTMTATSATPSPLLTP